LAVKYKEALSWYPHNIVKPDSPSVCSSKCHYEGNLLGATVITSVPIIAGQPTTFELTQNYPNPFNPSTTIRFSVPQRSRVRILVYDQLGRYVAKLEDKEFQPGFYMTTWEGKDQNGKHVTSGIYFVLFNAGSVSLSDKIVLIR